MTFVWNERKRRNDLYSGKRDIMKFDNVPSNLFITQLLERISLRDFVEAREMNSLFPLLSSVGRPLFFAGRKAISLVSGPPVRMVEWKKISYAKDEVSGNGG